MFDISFTELMIIGVVALVVIGPERLPRVARTIGHLVGRAQRYVGDVKSDIQREMDLDQLKDLKGQMEEAASSVKSSVKEATDSLRDPLEDARKALNEASESVDSLVKATQDELADKQEPAAAAKDSNVDVAPDDAVPQAAHASVAAPASAPAGPKSDAELADARLAHNAPAPKTPSDSSPNTPGTPL